MSASDWTAQDWTAVLTATEANPVPPRLLVDLVAFDLLVVHWDERAATVTIGFEGPLPSVVAGADDQHDHLTFHLSLIDTTTVEVAGWSHRPAERVEVTPTGAGRLAVLVTGQGSRVALDARAVVAGGHRTFRAGSP